MASESERIKPHKDGSKFSNPWVKWPLKSLEGAYNMAKFFGSLLIDKSDYSDLETDLPIMRPYFLNKDEGQNDGHMIRATWIGHASVLVEIDGFRVLCDPIFSNRCPPPVGPKRFRNPPCQVEDLPPIDAVLISHNHYDHMDHFTIYRLSEKYPAIEWLVPMNDGYNLTKMLHKPSQNITEMMWWDKKELKKTMQDKSVRKLTIYYTPAQHWSSRGLFDHFKSLWGSWSLIGPRHRFWFGGDTGYCPGFKEIGEQFGPFDGAAIPIGAYEPRNLMHLSHVNPEESLQIHKDIKSKRSMGIHWGTFRLTLEHYMEPKKILDELVCAEKEKVDFFTIKHGETLEIIDDSFRLMSGEDKPEDLKEAILSASK